MDMLRKYSMLLSDERLPYLVKESEYSWENGTLKSPEEIMAMMRDIFHCDRLPEEHAWMLALDNALHTIGIFEISHGTSAHTVLTPKEVYSRALLAGAAGIVVIHNHPSGDPTPSKDDVKVAKALKRTGKIVRVPLMDFIIIGKSCFSFQERGML